MPRLYVEHIQNPKCFVRKLLFSPENTLSLCANAYPLGKSPGSYFVVKALECWCLKVNVFHACTGISDCMGKNPMFPANSSEATKRYSPLLCLLLTGFLEALSSCGSR